MCMYMCMYMHTYMYMHMYVYMYMYMYVYMYMYMRQALVTGVSLYLGQFCHLASVRPRHIPSRGSAADFLHTHAHRIKSHAPAQRRGVKASFQRKVYKAVCSAGPTGAI